MRRSALALCALVALLAACGPLPAARAQDNPREVRAKAQVALTKGAYADAILLLQQLVDWFGTSTKEETVASMEGVYFALGTCHFFVGQFGEARDVFDTYLKKYRTGPHAAEVAVYIGDSYRFEGALNEALKAYQKALRTYDLGGDLKADVFASMVRCLLAADRWDKALPLLRKLYQIAPDFTRRNWAATLLTTAYLKEMDTEHVFRLIPYLLMPDSFASRSVALNMAALEAGDALFADEVYRDALWVYRLVYPHDELTMRSQAYLEVLQRRAERLKRYPEHPRALMRVLESIGELEAEIKALGEIENYDIELQYRIARAYMEIRRYREAGTLFYYLSQEAEGEMAEDALYYSFQCYARIQPWDRAFQIGEEYCARYPAQRYYDAVTITMGQMYAKLQDWPKVIEVLTKALEVSPNHESAAECMFLIGYASFMEEKFADAVTWLRRMNKQFPDNPREADGTYWTGMALMFDQKFEEAALEFDTILSRFPDCIYVEDTAFRRAVCEYGSSRFAEARLMLQTFLSRYPDSKLAAEAHMMLGDIGGSFGELDVAVKEYQEAMKGNLNVEFYNHCAFKAGEMLNEMNRFADLVFHFRAYINKDREGANVPLAMYWVGNGLWSMGEQKGALEFFRQGIEKYGSDRKALGIDQILEDWVGRGRGADSEVARNAWRDLADLRRKAEKEGQVALALRLKRIFLYAPDATEEKKAEILKDLIREETLTNASPSVLELILDEAQKQTNDALVVMTANQIIKDFTETDYALAARMVLARLSIANKDYKTAIKHLGVIREVFATSGEAAEALMLLGDIYLKQNKFDEADECYKSVLGVRDWRGPLWPAATYGRGEVARLKRDYDSAAAYYERIYVLYSEYRDWVVKAYLARADALAKLQQYAKAAEVLQEMLGNPDLAERPEAKDARERLETLKRRAS
jgi:tetratricopeptide (TPR) repeat protein